MAPAVSAAKLPKTRRWPWILLGIVGLLWWGSVLNRAQHPTGEGAKIRLVVQQINYNDQGYLKVFGIATNIGTAAAFSPTIHLLVHDSSGRTLLADNPTWPAGYFQHSMPPNASAAFEYFIGIPGTPREANWDLAVTDTAFIVVRR